jgi:hypothetical protein
MLHQFFTLTFCLILYNLKALNYHPSIDQDTNDETGAVGTVELKKKRTVKKANSSMKSEVWLNNGAVEGKIPVAQMRKFTKHKKEILQ